jgi:26S proteasome regulatory subunit N3
MEVDASAVDDAASADKLKQAIDAALSSEAKGNNFPRTLSALKPLLTTESLQQVIKQLNGPQALSDAASGTSISSITPSGNALLDNMLGLLVQVHLLKTEQNEAGFALSQALVNEIRKCNSRKLDVLASKVWFYYARFAELLGKVLEIRDSLLQAQRTATLRHDKASLATLITLLLRNYLLLNDVVGADKLISKTTFPTAAPNAVIARYLYYVARVRAIQLDYSSASDYLTNAIRKVDTNAHTAGFLQAVHKLNIVVQLLIGEIPAKSDLKQPFLEKALQPYAALVNAVRKGDLSEFGKVTDKYNEAFAKDSNASLVARLRNNVLKTGIRSISLSYSRISLKDVCLKLGLPSEESAEYIVSKAIHENIISATLSHEQAQLLSTPPVDIYSSDVPQHGFHERIKFCLELRNKSVRAMRFPEDTGRKAVLELEEERRRLEESYGDLDSDDDIDEL